MVPPFRGSSQQVVHFRESSVIGYSAEVVEALGLGGAVFVGEGLVAAVSFKLEAGVGSGFHGVLQLVHTGREGRSGQNRPSDSHRSEDAIFGAVGPASEQALSDRGSSGDGGDRGATGGPAGSLGRAGAEPVPSVFGTRANVIIRVEQLSLQERSVEGRVRHTPFRIGGDSERRNVGREREHTADWKVSGVGVCCAGERQVVDWRRSAAMPIRPQNGGEVEATMRVGAAKGDVGQHDRDGG